MFGEPVERVEDAALLNGSARFLADLDEASSALALGIMRSPFAHARVDLGGVTAPEDVELILPQDVTHLSWNHLLDGPPPLRPLAGDRVRYVGQPVAAVVAPTPEKADDAVGALFPQFEPLPAVADVESALAEGAPLVYDETPSNVIWHDHSDVSPEIFEAADVLVERNFVNQRMAPGMLECRGILAVPGADGSVTVHVGHQNPHKLKKELSSIFGVAPETFRVVVPAVGGAFGAKAALYPDYVLVVHAALATGQPVIYLEKRSENLVVTNHGRGQAQRIKVAASRDGLIEGLRVEIDADFGAAADLQRWCVMLTRRLLSGAYRIPHIEWSIRGVLTHTPPLGAFRGAGRPEAAYLVERAVDELARELAIDPAELRERNFIHPEDFPYETPTGAIYDSGDYPRALRLALRESDYAGLRATQTKPPGGKIMGVGIASYVEVSAAGQEYGSVSIDSQGGVKVRSGTAPHGQGHETAWAQLAAEQLGVDPLEVSVVHSDTSLVLQGGGTSGSRSAPLGGSAVHRASVRLARRLKEMAADSLEASWHDITLKDGRATVIGTDIGIDQAALVEAVGAPIEIAEEFNGSAQNYPFGTHVCAVEIDTETGEVSILRFVEVDDCGRVINPLIVEGQLHGGSMQGISQALAEEIRFDGDGQPTYSNLSTYLLPRSVDVTEVEVFRTETPTPANPLGLKGVGESGITGATPAVANAVADALSRLGVDPSTVQMPFTPERIWTAISEAK